MNTQSLATRLRRVLVEALAVLYMAALGFWIVVFFSVHGWNDASGVPWKWVPPTLGVAIWFLRSATWMTVAFALSVPLVSYCVTSRGTVWILILATCGLLLLSGALFGTPHYVESFGIVQTAPNGGTGWSRYDFPAARAGAVLILIPIGLAVLAPRARAKETTK